jgi:hypothetical protein
MVNWLAAERTAGQHWLRMEETAGPLDAHISRKTSEIWGARSFLVKNHPGMNRIF